jgi:hypothetical protein
MKKEVFNSIEKSISSSRLSTYKNHSANSSTQLIANYVLNAKISENFYFLLQNLEVALRNAIYDAFMKHYPHRNFFYLNETNPRNRYKSRQENHDRECWKMLCGAKYKLRNVSHINDGKIIAELNFGFWTKLLLSTDNKYTNMWRTIFVDVFPNYNIVHSIDNDKVVIGDRIDKIRLFRNRIFHYEPIFNYPNLEQIHDDIIEVLGWINKDMQKLSVIFDDFQYIDEEKYFIQKQLRGNNVLVNKKRRFRRKRK